MLHVNEVALWVTVSSQDLTGLINVFASTSSAIGLGSGRFGTRCKTLLP